MHYQTEDEDDIHVVFLAGINPNRDLERSDLEVTWSSPDQRIQHIKAKDNCTLAEALAKTALDNNN